MQKINSQNANNIITRLKSIFKFKADLELAAFLEISASTLSTWKSRNSLDYELIFAKCEQFKIDLHWLITGSPLNSETLDNEVEEPALEYNSTRQTKKEVFNNQEVSIRFVSAASHISYINNFNNLEYISKLPSIKISDMIHSGLYRSFEVTEDSMSTMFIPGDRILGKYVDDYKKIINFHPYIIVTEDNIQIRKVVSKVSKKGSILELHSHNPIYKPYSPALIDVKEIKEIWKWVPPLFRMSLLHDSKDDTIQLLQDKINQLSKAGKKGE